ncbi:MAG TPA: methyl-accepting chemotaxis protein [Rhodopseudomonas sp.]|uniref:methyl-accepting chemotaxis protein n=1 Tax=Rhodopseudomonas sp. TaxID=1078 RepID=UPI002ED78CBC
MLGLGKKQWPASVEAPPAHAAAPPLSPADPAPPLPHAELLQRWMSLAQMQQRVIHALAGEVARTSGFVESEADALSGRFRRLAVSAQQQTARVDSLTSLAKGVEVAGRVVPIHEVTQLLDGTLSDVVSKILMLSKDSMSMVYALDELNANVMRVEKCMEQLTAINGTTNMLALNARIEAERAGDAGAAFRIVANEVRELSKTTQLLSSDMNRQLKAVTEGIASGHATLKRVATIDMSENVLAKERLEVILAALQHRGDALETIVADAVTEAAVISADVDAMVTGIQFQDRTKQRLEHVVDTLQVIAEAIDDVKHATTAALPELMASSTPDHAWVKQLLERYTLSEMRERFVAELIDGKPVAWPEDSPNSNTAAASGSIELF